MSSNYKAPPVFSSEKLYSRCYVHELEAWSFVTHLPKKKQGLVIALSLPENDSTQIRDKVFSELKIEDLKKEDGVDTLVCFLDDIFKKDELTEVYEHYT